MTSRRLSGLAVASLLMMLVPGPATAGSGHRTDLQHVTSAVPLKAAAVADTTAPRLRIFHPREGARVFLPATRIWGWVEPGATLALNGSPVDVRSKGLWSAKVPLRVGANTFRFVATDAAGNDTTIVRHVTRVPLILKVKGIRDGATVHRPMAFYYGWVDPARTLRVNGKLIDASRSGFWATKVPLVEGTNTITFTATSANGAVTSVARTAIFAPFVDSAQWRDWSRTRWSGFGDHNCDGDHRFSRT